MANPRQEHPALSELGIVICSVYAALIVCCIAIGQLGAGLESNPQRELILSQLPLAFQTAFLKKIGLAALAQGMGLWTSYFFLGLPTFPFLYAIGWLINHPAYLFSSRSLPPGYQVSAQTSGN